MERGRPNPGERGRLALATASVGRGVFWLRPCRAGFRRTRSNRTPGVWTEAAQGIVMWNPFDRIRQRAVRQRYVPRPRVRSSVTTARLALAAVGLIVLAGAVLEVRGRRRTSGLLDYVAAEAVRPLDLLADAGRRHRLVFLGDVPGAVAPKRLAADAVDTLARAYALDALVLAVDSDLQPRIDRYLESSPEDVSILLMEPRTLHDAEGTSNAYLDVYRRVWQLNRHLGPDRRIRILAADAPGWPPARALSPARMVAEFTQRDAHMLETVRARVLDRSGRARMLFFMDGLHVLKGGAQVQTGGMAPIGVTSLAGLLDRQFPREVYSILVDAPVGRAVPAAVARFAGTRAFPVLRDRRSGRSGAFALRSGPRLDIESNMIKVTRRSGIGFSLVPDDYRLADFVDAYVFLGN